MSLSVRRATPADREAVSRICLLTGDAGTSAVSVYTKPELIGLVYAEPYVALASAFGYILVSTNSETGEEKIVGYLLGAVDSRAFEAEAKREWWPRLASTYPVDAAGNDADKRLYNHFAKPYDTPQSVVDVYPAHMHVDILPEAQRKGWGRRLLGKAVEHIKAQGGKGLHLGIDSRNDEARKFYQRVGFVRLDSGGEGEYYGLDFDSWKS